MSLQKRGRFKYLDAHLAGRVKVIPSNLFRNEIARDFAFARCEHGFTGKFNQICTVLYISKSRTNIRHLRDAQYCGLNVNQQEHDFV